MKNKKKAFKYPGLTRKLYLYIVAAASASIVLVIFLREATRGKIASAIIDFFISFLGADRDAANDIYQHTIRNNLEGIFIVTMIVCFLIMLRFLISRFARYFNEIDGGIDILIEGNGREIDLSPEMDALEKKLVVLKQTLEKRELDAKLAEQRKNDLVMYLAHDIKTPLTSVIGYLTLLDEAPDMPSEQRARYVRVSLDKANRLEQLMDEFFEITRYNLQTIPLAKTKIDLSYMLAQMADEFFPQLSAAGKEAEIHAPEDLTVYGDPDKLARVFNNIMKNAVAYGEGNSVINITANATAEVVSVTFTNDGGIPKDKLNVIFDRFYRLDSSRSSGSGSAGLGLAVAKEIVIKHGGSIYADSDGERTSFTVELPVVEE